MSWCIPLEQRPFFIGILSAIMSIGATAGPLLGGVFTTKLTWRWCFWINIPFGCISVLMIALCLTDPRKDEHARTPWLKRWARFDWPGTVLFTASLICLFLALEWGGTTYAWSNGRIIALLVLFVVLLVAFGAVEVLRPDHAMLPLRVMRQRSMIAGSVYVFLMSASLETLEYYVCLT